MRQLLLTMLSFVFSVAGYCQQGSVSFYIVAAQDQWPLFMGTNAFKEMTKDLQEKKGLVIVYLIAGDESCNGRLRTDYAQARQAGANHAVEFCANQINVRDSLISSRVNICGHNILKYTYRHVISYCLQLPSGCNAGGGVTGQSLKYLYRNPRSSITAIDSSATYEGWNSLVATLRNIIRTEVPDIDTLSFNIADTSLRLNPGDKPDRIYGSRLLLAAIDSFDNYTLNLYREACIAHLPTNLSHEEIANKAALFSQYDFGLTENGQPSEWKPENVKCFSKNYFRTVVKRSK